MRRGRAAPEEGERKAMVTALFIVALIAVLVLCIHVTLELNSLEKSIVGLTDALRKRYGTTPHETAASAPTGKPESA